MQSLLEAHDIVASKCYESPPSSPEINNASVNNQIVPVDAIRILGIHKRAGEPLVSMTSPLLNMKYIWQTCIIFLISLIIKVIRWQNAS